MVVKLASNPLASGSQPRGGRWQLGQGHWTGRKQELPTLQAPPRRGENDLPISFVPPLLVMGPSARREVSIGRPKWVARPSMRGRRARTDREERAANYFPY